MRRQPMRTIETCTMQVFWVGQILYLYFYKASQSAAMTQCCDALYCSDILRFGNHFDKGSHSRCEGLCLYPLI